MHIRFQTCPALKEVKTFSPVSRFLLKVKPFLSGHASLSSGHLGNLEDEVRRGGARDVFLGMKQFSAFRETRECEPTRCFVTVLEVVDQIFQPRNLRLMFLIGAQATVVLSRTNSLCPLPPAEFLMPRYHLPSTSNNSLGNPGNTNRSLWEKTRYFQHAKLCSGTLFA